MHGVIDNYNFGEMEIMKYYSPPASWLAEKKVDNVKSKIFSLGWLGAQKMDGYFSCFIKDEDGDLILKTRSRSVSGEFLNKVEWVPQLHEFFNALPNGTCLLGELYLPEHPGSKNITSLMGCLKDKCIARQKDEKMHFYVFDCLAFAGASSIKMKATERFNLIKELSNKYNYEYIDWAEYVEGQELWNTLQDILNSGGEGMVILSPDSIYEPGKRPSKTTLKVKQELHQTIDCIIIGANPPTREYTGIDLDNWKFWVNAVDNSPLPVDHHVNEYDDGKPIVPVTKGYYYRWAGSLKLGLYKDGKVEYFGDLSGLTNEMKENWKNYIGKVVEVGGMSIDNKSVHIRHPRMLRIREDKTPKECLWSQVQ